MSHIQISDDGLKFIQKWEGCRLEPYQDIAGIWTIGYGHTRGIVIDGKSYITVKEAVLARSPQDAGNDVVPFTITHEYAVSLLKDHVNGICWDLRDFLKGTALSQRMMDAIISLAYNIGVKAFQSSTVLKRLKVGAYEEAAHAITWWDKTRNPVTGILEVSEGLKRRRAEEARLFWQGVAEMIDETEGVVEQPGACASCG